MASPITLDQLKAAVDAAIATKTVLSFPILVAFLVVGALGAFIGAYLKRKGENLATREDLQKLTKEVEEVKTTYQKQIEDYKAEIDRTKTDDARKYEAKKASFLRASEAIAKALNYAMTLADRKLPSDGKTDPDLADFGPALVQLHYFSEYQTIEKALEFGRVFTHSIGEILRARLGALQFDWQINWQQQQIDERQKRLERLDEEMLILLRADVNHPLLPSLREAIQEGHRQLAELHGGNSELIGKQMAATAGCRAIIIQQLPAIFALSRDMLLCARRELNLPIENERYAALMDAQGEQAIGFLRSLTRDLEQAAQA